MVRTTIKLESEDFINYSNPIAILSSLGADEFYDVFKIVWKYKHKTVSYDYLGNLIFKIGNERIATLQGDSISSQSNVACVSNANLCQDRDCPKIELGEGVKLYLDGTPPSIGDGSVVIEIYYYVDNINNTWDEL
jgi:hypothetical protein